MKAEFDLVSLTGKHITGSLEFPEGFNISDVEDMLDYLLDDFGFMGWAVSSAPYVIYEDKEDEQA